MLFRSSPAEPPFSLTPSRWTVAARATPLRHQCRHDEALVLREKDKLLVYHEQDNRGVAHLHLEIGKVPVYGANP